MRTHIVGCTGFKLIGETLESGVLKSHTRYHFSTTLIRGKLVEQVFLTIKHANACGTVDFVSTEDHEIAVQGLYVNSKMGHTLRTI